MTLHKKAARPNQGHAVFISLPYLQLMQGGNKNLLRYACYVAGNALSNEDLNL